jgi:hypothetical protein
MQNILPLPDELLKLVYLYDSTYKEIFDICMDELRMNYVQERELTDFLVEQELQRNMFHLIADMVVVDILNIDI